MSTMLSWHKPGQKIVCISDSIFLPVVDGPMTPQFPISGETYTIAAVEVIEFPVRGDVVGFELVEMTSHGWYAAALFQPVYPEIIDQLRNLNAPTPERVDDERVPA